MDIQKMSAAFTLNTGIEIPKNVLDFYTTHESKNINFQFPRLFSYVCQSSGKPEMTVLLSEEFAVEILNLIYAIPEENRMQTLFNQIKANEFNEINDKYHLKNNKLYNGTNPKPSNDDVEEFILDEIFFSVNDYDYKNNKFNFPLVQKAYKNLGSDSNYMKVILILWADCGGEGGIIVRGKNTGYCSGYAHIDDSVIVFNEKTIMYRGYMSEKHEIPYIEMDKSKLK
ncbi:hypothetical protein [Kordia sp.]|uniref:hypothetical protein n=1 Tax=Kordia sp. TaxID=1965332 RepID=UPI003D6C44AE